jgi:hypothetical protein
MDRIFSFFIFCSGVDRALLAKTPTEQNKYAGIGATVFFTGIFAFVAAGYALFTVFHNVISAVFFGLIWGLMIFNLDRYIVGSMKKKGSIWRDLGMALPRVVLAVIISIVIAKPLELKIFESEIQSELITMQQENRKLHEDKLRLRFEKDLKEVDDELATHNGTVKRLLTNKQTMAAQALSEADGTGGSKIRNMGPIYKAKQNEAQNANAEYERIKAELTPKIALLETRKAEILKARDAELAAMEKAALQGFASRLEALDRITSNSQAILIASIFIMLLFIAIETAPLFVKLISDRSPYDYVLDTLETDYEMEHKEYTSLKKLATNTKLDFERQTRLHRTQKEIEAENELFGLAIKSEVEQIKQTTYGLRDYLAKGRILDIK